MREQLKIKGDEMKINAKMKKAAAVVLILLAGAGIYYFLYRGEVSTDDAAIDGHVVEISPKVAGYIKTVYVKDNQIVKAGDVIMEIDSRDYDLQVKNAQAALQAAQSALAAEKDDAETTLITAPAGVEASQEKVNAARAAWEKAASDKQRMQMLIENGACSQQEYDQAVESEKSARAALQQMQAELNSASSAPSVIAKSNDSVKQLEAQVEKAAAELEQARTNLQYTKITAPIDGRITKKSVEAGAYVQSGTQLCSLVSSNLWVTANFKENQLKGMRPGDKVDISVDAFPNMKLTGVVDSFQAGTGSYFSLFPAENATGNFVKTVQRIPVKIVFNDINNEQLSVLGLGMSVIPTVHLFGAR